MDINNKKETYSYFSTDETGYIIKTEEYESILKKLLPDFFLILKKCRLLIASTYNSHDSYFEYFNKAYLAGHVDADEIENTWLRGCIGGIGYANDLYRGTCYKLALLSRYRREIYADTEEIFDFHNSLCLMVRAIQELNTVEITEFDGKAIGIAKKGGERRKDSYTPAKAKLIELLDTSAPATGWKSRVEAINAIEEPLGQFIEEEKIHLKSDALIATVGRWARTEPEVAAAFERHVDAKRKLRNN